MNPYEPPETESEDPNAGKRVVVGKWPRARSVDSRINRLQVISLGIVGFVILLYAVVGTWISV